MSKYLRIFPILFCVACTPTHMQDEVTSEVPDAVAFAIIPDVIPNQDTLRFTAIWTNGRDSTRFKVVMTTPEAREPQQFVFGRGWLIASGPSRSRGLINRLADIHGVLARYPPREPVDSLAISVGILGHRLSRTDEMQGYVLAGGFTPDPPGPWLCTKLFLDEISGEPVELFLNVNMRDKRAEFMVKDPANGTALLSVLASVFEAE